MMEWTHDVRVDKGHVDFNCTAEFIPPGHNFMIELSKMSNITIYLKLVRIDKGPKVLTEKVVNVTSERNVRWYVSPDVDYPAVYRFGYIGVDHDTNQINNAYIETVYVNKDLNVTLTLDHKRYNVHEDMFLNAKNIGKSAIIVYDDYWFEKNNGTSWVRIGNIHSSPTKIYGTVPSHGIGSLIFIGEYVTQTLHVYLDEPGDYRVCKNVSTELLNNTKVVYAEFSVVEGKEEPQFQMPSLFILLALIAVAGYLLYRNKL